MKVLKDNNNTIKTKTCQPSLLYLNISKATILNEKGRRKSVTSRHKRKELWKEASRLRRNEDS